MDECIKREYYSSSIGGVANYDGKIWIKLRKTAKNMQYSYEYANTRMKYTDLECINIRIKRKSINKKPRKFRPARTVVPAQKTKMPIMNNS